MTKDLAVDLTFCMQRAENIRFLRSLLNLCHLDLAFLNDQSFETVSGSVWHFESFLGDLTSLTYLNLSGVDYVWLPSMQNLQVGFASTL